MRCRTGIAPPLSTQAFRNAQEPRLRSAHILLPRRPKSLRSGKPPFLGSEDEVFTIRDRLFRENFGDLDPRIVQLSPRLTMPAIRVICALPSSPGSTYLSEENTSRLPN